MLDCLVLLKLFLWRHYPFKKKMYFSSYCYYYNSALYRLLFQKHNGGVAVISSLSFRVSNTDVASVEDFEVLHTLKGLEDVTGRKSSLQYFGSRYVGTTKKAYYLALVDVRKDLLFFVLESLSLFFISNFHKRFGQFDTSVFQKIPFTLCCKDLQIFQNYYLSSLKSNFLVSFYASGGSILSFLDELQCYKFNIKQ